VQHVTVRVPASTSNLGPGFDCLGVALRLYNDVSVARGGNGVTSPIMRVAARRFFAAAKCRPFSFSCAIRSEVPVARGLGSSATLRVGLVHALNELAHTDLTVPDLFAISAHLEGHPDNAAPATFGGFTVTRPSQVQRFDVSVRLAFVLLIPGFEIATKKARALLPKKIGHADAVRSGSNAAAITAAFASKKYNNLRGHFSDGLHQPYRSKLVPFLDGVIAAAEEAGALGAFLSGSGSAICAVTLHNTGKVADAMRRACQPQIAHTIVTQADNRGARFLHSKRQ
jgi:homoserine kinase